MPQQKCQLNFGPRELFFGGGDRSEEVFNISDGIFLKHLMNFGWCIFKRNDTMTFQKAKRKRVAQFDEDDDDIL